jgi:glycosyltransferase involved in cell wall biosynthesis
VRTSVDAERLCVLEDICHTFHVKLAHVRHLLGNGPETLDTFHQLGIPVILSFHDYYTVCPTIQLIDGNGVFCGGRCTPGSEECSVAKSWFRGGMPVLKHQYVHEHRSRMAAALQHCKCFITTCESAREILQNAFPALRDADFRLIEHGRELPRAQLANPPRTDVPARVICLGNIDRAKGGQLIEKLMVMDRQLGCRFEFHFLGNQASTFKPRSFGGICHGPYERDDLVEILRRIAPSFSLIASIWPETYCHTLTESWAAGLPVFASNLGALRERVQRHGGGWLLDPHDPEGWYHAMVEVLQSPPAYERAVAEVAAYRPRTTKRMTDDYRQIYAACLNGKETVR